MLVGLIETVNAQTPFSDPNNTRNWRLLDFISDEFENESLDKEKWFVQGTGKKYENRFKGRAPSQFAPENVAVLDGRLIITSRWQPEFDFSKEEFFGYRYENITSGAIISKNVFQFGYIETRCKAADGPISSSLWTTGKEGELDVFEHFGRNPESKDSGLRYQSSFHDWRMPGSSTYGKRIWTNVHQLPFRVAEGFHVYGLEWDRDFIKMAI